MPPAPTTATMSLLRFRPQLANNVCSAARGIDHRVVRCLSAQQPPAASHTQTLPSTNNTVPTPQPRSAISRKIVVGAIGAVGVAAGVRYLYTSSSPSAAAATTQSATASNTATSPPADAPSLGLSQEGVERWVSDGHSLTLFQYTTCPFCNKVQAYLDFHQLPYRTVEVNPLTKSELKGWSDDYKKVPVLVMDGKRIVDSNNIISYLHQQLQPYRRQPHAITADEESWRSYTETSLIPLITPSLYFNWQESLAAFDYLYDNSSMSSMMKTINVYAGAAVMYKIGQKRLNSDKFKDKDVRQMLVTACNDYVQRAVNAKTGFHSQNSREPDTADLAIFGVLRATIAVSSPIRALLVGPEARTTPAFREWYGRMVAAAPPMQRAQRLDAVPKDIDFSSLAKLPQLQQATAPA